MNAQPATLSHTDSTPAAQDHTQLQESADRIRHYSMTATSAAGSGHPTSSMSCADILAVIFGRHLRFDIEHPHDRYNDRFILSKGHAAPGLWAAWQERGAIEPEMLGTLRRIDSNLEGHPTPRSPLIDVATGSLGQGLSAGLGMVLASRLDGIPNRVFVLLGDGEMAEGNVWEAVELAAHLGIDRLVAIVDINRLGQSDPTMLGHDIDAYARRFEAFGWSVQTIDGHDLTEIDQALESAEAVAGKPSVILARTIKGKGVSFLENRNGLHGKPVDPDKLDQALREVGAHLRGPRPTPPDAPTRTGEPAAAPADWKIAPPDYSDGKDVATRTAFGKALDKLGKANPDVVVVDGDVKNSTRTEQFFEDYEARAFEGYIAEQNMVAMATGLAAMGKIPVVASFACFLERAADQIRIAGIGRANIKLAGSHAGVSIGQDGPSQMALEDIGIYRAVPGSMVLYPCDAVSAERLTELAIRNEGLAYLRLSRPKTPVLYSADEKFRLGGSHVLLESEHDEVTIIAAGVTVFEALDAARALAEEGIQARVIDLYSIKPIDRDELERAVRETGRIITVEDHYPAGGLGEAVLSALAGKSFVARTLAVNDLPRSGNPKALMEALGISHGAIADAARELVDR